ncbi:MAG: MCP four helix bundle domain-containing protein [Bacteroidales bacterium]|nr:MCP four helix bundle domain-containing protein [Bacteroidales bacterium]
MKIKISTKISILVIILIVVSLTIGIYGIYSIKNVNESVNTMYIDRVLPLAQLKKVSDAYAVQIVEVSQKLEKGIIDKQSALSDLKEASEIVTKNWNDYMSTTLTKEEEQIANQAIELRQASKTAYEKLVQIISSSEDSTLIKELSRFNTEELYQAIDPFTAKIDQLIKLQLDVSSDIHEESDKVYNNARTLTIVINYWINYWNTYSLIHHNKYQ